MTLTDPDLTVLLAALKAGEMTDTIRTSLERVLQQLIEAEATASSVLRRTSASRRARTSGTGYRPRLLSTPAGDVELEIPKLRQGSFFPSLLERRRRIDRALGVASGISKSAPSGRRSCAVSAPGVSPACNSSSPITTSA